MHVHPFFRRFTMSEINIGILVNTHGLKGEVKVKPMTDFAEIRFAKGSKIHIQYEDKLEEVTIQYAKWAKQLLIVKFKEYNDINLVEKFKGSTLSIDEANLHELEEDEAYFFELVDCEVYDEDNHYLGSVSEVIETNANAVLRVSDGEREFLVPFVNAFVKDFVREEAKIIIKLVDGLL